MKESIEHSIKTSLENYELPYNPDAWKAMNAKLDAVQPVKKPAYKWYIAASAAVVLSVGAYLYYTPTVDSTTTKENNTEVAQKESNPTTNLNSETEKTNSSSTSTTTSATDENNDPNATAILPLDPASETNNAGVTTSGDSGDHSNNPVIVDKSDNTNKGGQSNDDKTDNPGNNTPPAINFVAPSIGDNLCQGANIKLNNTNDLDITVIYPNGIIWTGKKNSSTTLNPSVEGIYLVGYMNDKEFVKEGSFTVLPQPSSGFDFIREDEKYDDRALPATYLVATGVGSSYEWKFDQATATGKEATAHFFKQGTHDISLTVKDVNGCQSTTEKTITIDEQYNLMAMKAFAPTDIDPANNTFMPFALTQRGDDFHMIIIDPTDGHLIYETRDASKGWDGIDKQTGAMAPYEKAYIWKVTIENRMIGESPEYAGTVVLMKNRR